MDKLAENIKPFITVITPTFNSEEFIGETIESVLKQTYTNWEMIIVDDCSSDKTNQVVASYQQRDNRIKSIQLKKNAGSAIARNTAMDAAKGRFIAFLDSDDLWMPKKLEIQLQFMLDNEIAFSFTEYVRIRQNGTITNRIVKAPTTVDYIGLMKHCAIGCLTVMIDTEKTGKEKMINIRSRQDYVLWLTLTKKGYLAYGLPEVLSKYRLVQNSISSNKFKMVKQNWHVYRKIEGQSVLKTIWYLMNYAFHYSKRRFYKKNRVKKFKEALNRNDLY